jgi:hypothetical protein
MAPGAALALADVSLLPLGAALVTAVGSNLGLFRLFWRRGGVRLLAGGFLLQQFYYLYALAGMGAALFLYFARGPARVEAPWRARVS